MQRFLFPHQEDYVAPHRYWSAERQTTRRIMSRSILRAVAGKDFRHGLCSIVRVPPATRHRSHPCNVFVPASVLHLFPAEPLHEQSGANSDIPEPVGRQTEWSSFVHGTPVIISRASFPRRSAVAGRLLQGEAQCTAKESSPVALPAKH